MEQCIPSEGRGERVRSSPAWAVGLSSLLGASGVMEVHEHHRSRRETQAPRWWRTPGYPPPGGAALNLTAQYLSDAPWGLSVKESPPPPFSSLGAMRFLSIHKRKRVISTPPKAAWA